jgi:ATP-dependent protease ClpP protease subunit
VSKSNDFATSTVATLSTSKSDDSSYSAVKDTHVVKNVEGAVSFDSASAKNVAVDGSTINDTNNYSVILAGSAQQNASALNIVNSAGGMVANGLNIAHTTNLTTMPTLTQVNNISQVR